MKPFWPFTPGKRHGQSLVEFALILPVLLLLIMGTIDFGRALFTYAQASSQLRQALRLAAVIGYAASPIPPYRDCNRIRSTAQSVFFSEETIVEIIYLKSRANPAESAWDSVAGAFDEASSNAQSCPPGMTQPTLALQNGDVMRIRETIKVRMITPFFPPLLTFTLQGQRSVVTTVTLASVEYCGDLICQPDRGETTFDPCPGDCTSGDGHSPGVDINPFECGGTVNPSSPINIIAMDMDPVDGPGTLVVSLILSPTSGPDIIISANYVSGFNYVADLPATLLPGTYDVKASVEDSNTPGPSETSVPCQMIVSNNHAPVVNISPGNGAIVASSPPPDITVDASDAEDGAAMDCPAPISMSVEVTDSSGPRTATWDGSSCSGNDYVVDWPTPVNTGAADIQVTVTDSESVSTSKTVSVTVQNCSPSCPPSIGIVPFPPQLSPNLLGVVDLTITVTDDYALPGPPTYEIHRVGDPAGTPIAFPGSTSPYTVSWDTASVSDGDYVISYHVEDSHGQTDDETITVTVKNTMHISSLDINYHWPGGNDNWTADIVVTVANSNGYGVPNIMVTGNWEVYPGGGSSSIGRSSCSAVTDSLGRCTIVVSGIPHNKNFWFMMFAHGSFPDGTVTGGTLVYVAAENLMNEVSIFAPTIPNP